MICNPYHMDIRQLQYFIAVAEEGGFAAPLRGSISPSRRSASRSRLWSEVSVSRCSTAAGHKIKLTSAGDALLRRSRPIVEAIGNARQETLRVGRGEVGQLEAGVMSGALLGRRRRCLPLSAKRLPMSTSLSISVRRRIRSRESRAARSTSESRAFAQIQTHPLRELRSHRNNYGRKNWRSPCPPIIPWQRGPNCR